MATMKNRVIWQEGLFVLPQHFQQQQRNHEYHLNQRMDALADFAWGFTSLVLNPDLLAQGQIMIVRPPGARPAGPGFSSPGFWIAPGWG